MFDNIAYGIKIQKKSKDYIKERVEEPLEIGEKVQVLISRLFIYNEERIEKLSNSGLNTPVEFYI